LVCYVERVSFLIPFTDGLCGYSHEVCVYISTCTLSVYSRLDFNRIRGSMVSALWV
jgi:hypothetical protein